MKRSWGRRSVVCHGSQTEKRWSASRRQFEASVSLNPTPPAAGLSPTSAAWLPAAGWRTFVAYFHSLLGIFALLLRLVLLAAAASFWILYLTDLPLTLDTSAWLFYATPIVFAVVMAVGAWAFFTALAGQKLLAEA